MHWLSHLSGGFHLVLVEFFGPEMKLRTCLPQPEAWWGCPWITAWREHKGTASPERWSVQGPPGRLHGSSQGEAGHGGRGRVLKARRLGASSSRAGNTALRGDPAGHSQSWHKRCSGWLPRLPFLLLSTLLCIAELPRSFQINRKAWQVGGAAGVIISQHPPVAAT